MIVMKIDEEYCTFASFQCDIKHKDCVRSVIKEHSDIRISDMSTYSGKLLDLDYDVVVFTVIPDTWLALKSLCRDLDALEFDVLILDIDT